LFLNGRAKAAEVTNYFYENKKSRQLVSGWLQPTHSKDNFSQFADQLGAELKIGVVKPVNDGNFSLYIFPVKQHPEFASSFL